MVYPGPQYCGAELPLTQYADMGHMVQADDPALAKVPAAQMVVTPEQVRELSHTTTQELPAGQGTQLLMEAELAVDVKPFEHGLCADEPLAQ